MAKDATKSKDLPERRKPGAPIKLTPAVQASYVAAILAGANKAIAAATVGVGQAAVNHWLLRGAAGEEPFRSFAIAVERARAQKMASLIALVETAAEEDLKHWKAAAWLLTNVHGVKPDPPDPSSVAQPHLAVGSTDVIDAAEVPDDVRLAEERVMRLTADLASARADRVHGAIARIGRELDDANIKLFLARKAANAGTSPENMPEEQFEGELRRAAEMMPEAHLRILADIWLERHRMKAVSDRDGGSDDADDG